MKTGKEIKSNKFKNYNVVFGSVNNKHPKAVYIDISAWAQPININEVGYNRIIKNLNKKVKQTLFDLLDNDDNYKYLSNRSIVDMDIRESGVKFGKRSFISCELTIYLNSEIQMNSEHMMNKLNEVTKHIILNVFETNKDFSFHKRKK